MIRKLKNIYHFLEALVSNIIFDFPSRQIKVVGITGTDGKTTTTSLVYHILKEAGFSVSMISTVYAKIGKKVYDTGLHTTTPSAYNIQKYLKEAVKNKDDYFVLETTAHAIDQYRIWGVVFQVGLITNVTHEHLKSVKGFDYFISYENYLMAKAKLFNQCKIGILNKDDESYLPLSKYLATRKVVTKTYSLKKPAIYNWENSFKTDLPGEYNRYNVLAAFSICQSLGIPEKTITKAAQSFHLPPGRFEVVSEKNPMAILDFAHTINGIRELLKTVKGFKKDNSSRIIHVFGAAGHRDMTKRDLMGQASSEYADVVILTEEDYRTEDPLKISKDIAVGLTKNGFKEVGVSDLKKGKKKYTFIADRKKAIQTAFSIANSNDIIVSTGKGHEKSLCRGNKEYPWDEKKVILDALKK